MLNDRLKNTLSELGFAPTDEQLTQFTYFYELLVERNKVINLTSITEWDEVVTKHFVDSVAPFAPKTKGPQTVCRGLLSAGSHTLDLGTGAGFPSIPLKIMFPVTHFVLVDALGKRVDFLHDVIDKLGLTDIDALHGRAEDLAKDDAMREGFDLVVSRAVSRMSILAEYCLPFVKQDGCFVAYKSEQSGDELNEARNAITILGGGAPEMVTYTLPDSDLSRSVIIVPKVSPTPDKYPRRAGKPEKKPL